MNAITTTSTPAPPSYNDSAHAHANEYLPTSELLGLQLEGESVFARGSGAILYKLTQAPLSGTESALGVGEIVFRPSPPDSEEPRVNTRMRQLYVVKAPIVIVPTCTGAELSEKGVYHFEPQSGPTHCFSHRAVLKKGIYVPFFGRMGSTWRVWTEQKGLVVLLRGKKTSNELFRWWRDEKEKVVAVESVMDGSFVLELKTHLDKKMLNLLVTTWCAIIWHVNREKRKLEVRKAHKKIW